MPDPIRMPDLGTAVDQTKWVRRLETEGDQAERGEPICAVETDKAASELESAAQGILLRRLVPEGEEIEQGRVIAYVGAPGECVADPEPDPEEQHPPSVAARAPRRTADGAGVPPPIRLTARIDMTAVLALRRRIDKKSGRKVCLDAFFVRAAAAMADFPPFRSRLAEERLVESSEPRIGIAIENNLYGASTPVNLVFKTDTIAERSAAYGIPGTTIDGNDVLLVHETARDAVERARCGDGPTLLELVTNRITGHSRRDPTLYQPEEEKKRALENEPIGRFARYLQERGFADQTALDRIGVEVDREIEAAVDAAMAAPEPEPEDALQDLFVE